MAAVERQGARLVRSADDLRAAHRSGTLAALLTCEGADFVEDDLDRVDEAHQLGARSMTLVHYAQNRFGDLQTEAPLHGGLSRDGRDLVREMNRLGMIVDLAHATLSTTLDALDVSSDPLMISHTHLRRSGDDHPRLISSDHARAVAVAGGLIGAWPAGVSSVTFEDFVDEVLRLVDVVGVGHVAIGSDLDANYKRSDRPRRVLDTRRGARPARPVEHRGRSDPGRQRARADRGRLRLTVPWSTCRAGCPSASNGARWSSRPPPFTSS